MRNRLERIAEAGRLRRLRQPNWMRGTGSWPSVGGLCVLQGLVEHRALATLLASGKRSQPSSQPLRCHSRQVHLSWSLHRVEYCPGCLSFSFHCVQVMRIRMKFSWRLFNTQKRYCETFHFLPSSSRILILNPSWSEIAESEAEKTIKGPTLCDPMDYSSHRAPLPTEFSRQEYWSEWPFPSPGTLPDQGSKLGLLHCRQILYHLSH